MKSIQRNVENIKKRNPLLGDYLCLAKAVKGRGLSRKTLVKSLKENVDPEEYSGSEQKSLIDYLERITKPLEEGEI